MVDHDCTCGRLRVGSELTEHRNWNPDCAVHGTASAWYNDPERRDARDAKNAEVLDLQRCAREARRRASGN